MKKFLCLFIIALMILSLTACQLPAVEDEVEEKPLWEGKFAVGYGRADITPDVGIPMGGFTAAGEASRVAEEILNALCMTCVAITDETGNTLLLYTFDSKNISGITASQIATAVSAATGIPTENIMISATHSHSTPDPDGSWQSTCKAGAITAAQDALADRAIVTSAEYGAAALENMSFVRHYITDKGKVIGDNFSPANAGVPVKHTTEADKELRIIRFNRDGRKPVLMANWLGHASMASTGSSDYGLTYHAYLSSDYVGFCRDYVEINCDCHFALYMGASGNINPASALSGEDMTKSAMEYGEELGEQILATAEIMTAGTTAPIASATTKFQSTLQHVDINALGIGSFGIITAPFEMFDTTSMAVRAESPFDITFVLTQTNGSYGYMPTEICWDYDNCYEVRNSKFDIDSAEVIVPVYLQLLNQVHS